MKIESKRLILRNWEDGDIELLDENELKDAFDRFEVNKSDYEMAYNEAKQLMNRLQNNKDTVQNFTDKYLKEMLVEGEKANL